MCVFASTDIYLCIIGFLRVYYSFSLNIRDFDINIQVYIVGGAVRVKNISIYIIGELNTR